MITRTFKLCLNAGTGSAPYINVSQYDEGETWLFELYSETGERYIPTTGAIVGVKSDGHGIANTGTVDSEGRVVITETQQMTASAGRAIYELSIDGLTHGTANFIVAVERKPTDDAVMSDSDLSLIQEAIDSAEVIVEVIGDGDPSEVIGEHVDAWLDNHPEATTTVLDGAITAPKINNSLWDKILVNEEASGTVASFDDGADDVPVSSLKVALEPIQTGTGDPSPSNIRPIIAANGKNLLQVTGTTQTINGVTFTIDNGVITANGTCTANVSYEVGYTDVTGSLLISGSASGADGTYGLRIGHGSASTFVGRQHGADYAYTASDRVWINIYVFTGVTLYNFKFYPMIRLASITDSTFQPYQGIMVERTGKNLYPVLITDESFSNNGSATHSKSDGVLTINTSSSNANSGVYVSVSTSTISATLRALGDSTRYISFDAEASVPLNVRVMSGALTTISVTSTKKRYIVPSTGVNLSIYGVSTESVLKISNVMVSYETDATYEPYQSTSYPMSLGREVYGGTVDLATGVLTVTHGIHVFGNEDAAAWSLGYGNACYISFASAGITNVKTTSTGIERSAMCKTDKFIPLDESWIEGFYNHNKVAFSLSNDNYFAFNTGSAMTKQECKAFIAGTQLYYPLATPTTVQLTPTEVKTLLGYNNISSTGTVDVIYHADTKLYVDKMTNVDNNIIAPTEEGFTATRNYTVNDLVIVNDTLYKCTANIASGSAITPNSNVTQTTLGALIKALS